MTVLCTTRQLIKRTFLLTVLLALVGTHATIASAGPRDQAKRIHERIAGVPPSPEVLDQMAANITNNGASGAVSAAYTAMEDPAFYDVTLKNFVAPWTNEAMSPFVPLNDYTATVIGIVRDNHDFRRVLYDDILYVGNASLNGISAYSTSNNDNYEDLERSGYSLSDDNVLEQTTQSSLNSELPTGATAGVITSRAAARAFFSAGTNRAMFRFTLLNHMCNDLEQVADVSLPPDRIRQDVSRSPGGDSRVFLSNCVGCHTGMDPMTQAFAYYDYQYNADTDPDGELGRLIYNSVSDVDPETGTRVVAKYHINSTTFEQGYVTPDDGWDNYWRSGNNRRLGWGAGTGSGNGAKSLGMEFADSDAFAQCQVKKVFRNVCLREPSNDSDRSKISDIVQSFRSSNFNLKTAFAESAAHCRGN
jgi:hypothetical protein